LGGAPVVVEAMDANAKRRRFFWRG
jgi:hypothetical protein